MTLRPLSGIETEERRREVALTLAIEATKAWPTKPSDEIKRAKDYERYLRCGEGPET